MTRQQLPPQIRKITVYDKRAGKQVIRYELRADGGINTQTGQRQQIKRRYATEKQARDALSEISGQAAQGTFVARAALTVEQACADYAGGRHNLRASARAKLAYDLAPLRERYGVRPVQSLTKPDIDALVADLLAGGTKTAKGRTRRAWSAVSVNKALDAWSMMLTDAQRQGLVVRNAAEHVNHVSVSHKDVPTYTPAEVQQILTGIADDRIGHAWELALNGLRRGEIAGLRWSDVDLENKTLTVCNNRVDAAGKVHENDPKSAMSRRTLPLNDRLVSVLKSAKARQARERLALGGGDWEYVVCNEAGQPYHPQVLSRCWRKAAKAAGVREIKLHAARHTCATTMHLQGVPAVIIAAWVGHTDPSLTLKLYAHSQADALKSAGEVLNWGEK